MPSSPLAPEATDIARALLRHRRLMAIVMAACMSLGGIVVALMPNLYHASATLVLKDPLSTPGEPNAAPADSMAVQTEVNILNSHSLALQTITRSNLKTHPEFSGASSESALVSAFAKRLYIRTHGSSRAIETGFRAEDPELAARIANAHAESYLEAQVAFKQRESDKLRAWFEARVRSLKADAMQKAQAAEDFRVNEKLLTDDMLKSTLMQNLKIQTGEAAQDLGSLRARYGPKHPRVKEAQARLSQLHHAIMTEGGAGRWREAAPSRRSYGLISAATEHRRSPRVKN